METQLTIKHLAAYLPYGLKAVNEIRNFTVEIKGLQTDNDVIHSLGKSPIKFIKPILRNLSDLTKEIEVNGEKFCPYEKYNDDFGVHDDYLHEFQNEDGSFDVNDCKNLPQYVFYWLVSIHFDVFGLIPAGLAIDINTLER